MRVAALSITIAVIATTSCNRSAPTPVGTSPPIAVAPRGNAPTLVIAPPATAPVVPVLVAPPPFPTAPQVSGHGTGGTCEAACRVEQRSYLRTMCGNDHGAFREMDRECRSDAQRAYRECVSRCTH